MANQDRVALYLFEIACVAYWLRNRERARDLLDAGDHAVFRQQAVLFFGAAPAGTDTHDYILELQDAVRTQRSFFRWLDARTVIMGGVSFSGKSLVRRAKLRSLYLADEGFAKAHPQYFLPDGDLTPLPNVQIFDHFATWTMREHPGWTTLRDIDNHCRSQKQWKPPAWVAVFFDRIFPPIVAVLFAAAIQVAIRVFLFPLE